MKNFMKKLKCAGAIAALFLCGKAQASNPYITRDAYLIYVSTISGITATGVIQSTAPGKDTDDFVAATSSFTSVAYFKTDGVNYLSAQAVVSSVTYVAQTFTDGQASSVTFKVNSYTALSSATATGSVIKISSDTALVHTCVSGGAIGLGSFNVCNPANWAVDLVTSSNTACNIAAAIQATGVVLSTCAVGNATGIIYSSATTYGSIWNTFGINVTSITAISSSTFSGGQDNQSITVNGTILTANQQWYPVTSNAVTATNLATAINNSSTTTGVVANAGANAIVYATATAVGFNYAVATSSQQALTLAPFISSGPASAVGVMVGGSSASYTINTATITLTQNSNFDATGLPVLYTNGGTNITGLTTGTTYFIIDMTSPSQFQLAATSTGSVNAIPIQLASSATKTTADTFTLTPLPITGAGIAYSWVVSDDPGIGWSPWATTTYGQTIAAGAVGTFNSTGTITTWDLGHVTHGWVGVQVTPPVTGAISLKIKTIGKGD